MDLFSLMTDCIPGVKLAPPPGIYFSIHLHGSILYHIFSIHAVFCYVDSF